MKIRIGIVGYGNLGKGVIKAVTENPDMEVKAIFTRREPSLINLGDSNIPVLNIDKAKDKQNDIDVMILCGGSATDIPEQGPFFAEMFNTVDSYDNHTKMPEYVSSIEAVATKTTAIIGAGWDPGLFSMMRALFEATVPNGANYTFWGEGLSQGHSDAIRRIEGVKFAAQYTIPKESAVDSVRSGKRPELIARERMSRNCFVVTLPNVDTRKIEEAIVTMPAYFADYDTTVNFISEEEFLKNHTKMPHGGMVLRSASTGESSQVMEFSLKLESNPEFTSSVMVAYARAAYKMAKEGLFGAKTVLDVPLSYISQSDRETLIKDLL